MNYQRIKVKISDIQPEVVDTRPLLQKSLMFTDEPIKDIEVYYNGKGYKYIDGRHRGEELRKADPETEVWVKCFDVDKKDYHIMALIGNSGRNNIPDECVHCAELRDSYKMSTKRIGELSGLGWQTVNMRLKIYDNLVPPLFELFKQGKISQHSALEIIKIPKEDQQAILDIEGKLTQKAINNYRKSNQKEKIGEIAKMFKVGQARIPAVVIFQDDMERLMSDGYEVVEVEYKGKILKICRCEELED